jgi:hypothetical protein
MAISLYSNNNGEKSYMSSIDIFTGKQKEHNTQVLTLLYDNGPLSTWEMASKLTRGNKHSLNATLSRRTNILVQKGYLRKDGSKLLLRFKGMIAVLILLPKTRMWNPIWKEHFNRNIKFVEREAKPILGMTNEEIQKLLKFSGLCLDDFSNWIDFADTVKTKLTWIKFDKIKDNQLLALIIMEAKRIEELQKILHPNLSSDAQNSID